MAIDAATWRTHPYTCQPWLYIDQPPVIFRAVVTGTIAYPVADVPYTSVSVGAYTDVRPGMLIVFESVAGADDQGRSIARRAATSSVIKMGRCSQGTQDGEVSIAAGSIISVYDHRPPWAKIPFCDTDGSAFGTPGQFYKFFDFDFATYGVNQGPVVNMGGGPAWVAYLDSSTSVGTLSLNVISAGSYGIDGNISTILWDVADGTITVGSTTTAGITATFPPGRRYIKCTITDTNGVTGYREMLVVVLKDGTPYVPITDFEIVDEIVYPMFGGNNFNVKVHQSIPRSTYIDGATVILWEDEYFNGVKADQSGFDHIKFVGYHHFDPNSVTGNPNGTIKETTLECLDAIGWLDTLPGFPQEISRQSSPTSWEEAKSLNMDKYFTILARWHSTLLEITDFKSTNTGDMYAIPRLGSDGDSIYQQIEKFADNGIGYHFVGDPQGRTAIIADQNLLNTSVRTTDVIVVVNDDDIKHIDFTFQRPPRYHWERGGAIIVSTNDASADVLPSTAFVIAPGPAPNIGLQDVDRAEQLVLDEFELQTRTGHRKERDNANYSYLNVEWAHSGDIGIYPAKGKWVTLTTTIAARRGLVFTNKRTLPYETRVQYYKPVPQITAKKVTSTLEVELIGSPALDDPQPTDPNPPDPQPTVDPVPADSANVFGSADNYIPDGWFSYEYGSGQVFLLSGGTTTGTIVARDISPYSIYDNLSGGHALIGGIQDPYNYKRLIVLFDHKICYTNDYTAVSPIWVDTGVTLPTGYLWDWRLRGSINRQGYFCWLATNQSDHSKRFYRTTDNFSTVSYSDIPNSSGVYHDPSILSAQWSNNIEGTNVDILMHSFNTMSSGIIYVIVTRKATDGARIYKSTDWGATWSDSGMADGFVNGHPEIPQNYYAMADLPYSKAGGAKNIGPTLMYRDYGLGLFFPFDKRVFNVTDNSFYVEASLQGYLAGNRCMNSFTLDGNHATIIYFTDPGVSRVRITDDGGETWTLIPDANAPRYGGSGFEGINGWPTNYKFMVRFGFGKLAYTTDRWATPEVNLATAYTTATHAAHSAHGVGDSVWQIVDCIPDLNARYPVGGVHPS